MDADMHVAPSITWPTCVDPRRLSNWMNERCLSRGQIENPELLSGGTQNVLIRFNRGGRTFVLRRPPEHLRSNSNETNRREARILAALSKTDLPHPELIAACSDENVLGAAFYLMEVVDGFNARALLPMPHAGDRTIRRRMGLALVEAIGRLALLDYGALGLANFGKIAGFLERQTDRWSRQLASYTEYSGWSGARALGNVEAVRDWLDAHRPASFHAGIIHGDYHLSNVMYRHDSGEIAAIVDWELSTIGAPLIDLGWLIATWPSPDGEQHPGIVGTAPWDGFPNAEELVCHYANATGLPVTQIGWYAVLACFKLAILLEGTHARACVGKAPRATGDRLHAAAVALFARACTWMQL
jgi:aminoglycoside phosphotransferase (APT) family kinase protein